jgi:hypothetical protein
LVEYEKLKRVTMPLDLDLYIITDVETDHTPKFRALRLKEDDVLHTPEGNPINKPKHMPLLPN